MEAAERDGGLAAHIMCGRELHAVSRLEQIRGSSCRLDPAGSMAAAYPRSATSIHPPRLEYLAVLKHHLEMLTRLQTTSREDAA